jgi:L-lactate dehydrogenase (cytochrome)
MAFKINSTYPSIDDLRTKSQKKIPKFAFEYLDGGCNDDVNIHRNTEDLREVQLKPNYLKNHIGSSLKTKLFDIEYDAPFGIAPIGLQGLIWPNSPEILAKSAFEHNIPFILSTVSTSSIERISELTEGKAWFQLYHPTENRLRDDIIKRAEVAQCPVLVVLCDVPSFGYRPRDIRNGLSLPPKMTIKNIFQILSRPHWAIQTLKYGQPSFETLKPYIPKGLNLNQLGEFMDQTFNGRLNEEKIKPIRDMWKGKLVLKGIASEYDTEQAIRLGVDGVIVSNHGGRQLDAGQSAIKALEVIAAKYGDQIEVMMDSGIRSGPDIARVKASGAKFAFLGRSFMYGVSALGKNGGNHTISLIKTELQQVMEQLCCEKTTDFSNHLIK